MKPENIELTDWLRIFLGEVPSSFMLEVVIRIAFMYLVLMVSMRLMGKRMSGMLSRTEMAALVSLAASIGVSLQDPSKGLLPVVVIAGVVVSVQRFIAWRSTQSAEFEVMVMDDMDILVEDGRLNIDCMGRTRITRDRLFAQLRHKGIYNLGKVQRVYLEANGAFSILQFQEEKAGLFLIPPSDEELKKEQSQTNHALACLTCGNLQKEKNSDLECTHCGSQTWEAAVVS